MRGLVPMALLVAIILAPTPAQAWSDRDDWRQDRCRFARLDDHKGFSTREVARTIECTVDHFGAVGGVAKALDVARCESGLQARVVSSNGMLGVYQFHPQTWSGVVDRHRKFIRRWEIRVEPLNGRSNVLLASTLFRNTWSPWACA